MSSVVGKLCPYCQQPITGQDEVLVCRLCRTPHHHRCWVEHQGCAAGGCGGAFGDAEVYHESYVHEPAEEIQEPGYDEPSSDPEQEPPVYTRYCSKCGAGVPDEAVACARCGSMLADGEDQEDKLPVFKTIINAFSFAFACFERKGLFIILLELGMIAAALLLAFPVGLPLVMIIPIVGVWMVIPVIIGALVFSAWICIGMLIIFIKIAEGKEVSVSDLFSGGKYLLPFIGASLLVALGTLLGLFPLFIPGLLFAFFNCFTLIPVIDRSCGVWESIVTSMRLVKNNFFLTLVLVIVNVLLGLIGSSFVFASLLTNPISTLITIYCYRKMLYGRG